MCPLGEGGGILKWMFWTPKNVRRFAAKITPNQWFYIVFMAPLGAPKKISRFCYPLASFSFILRAIWTFKMIHFPSKRGIYPQKFPPAAGQ